MTTPATYHTPTGWAERCTLYDDKAEHQIRLFLSRHTLYVSCTCKASGYTGANAVGDPTYHQLAPITTAEEALMVWRKHHQEMTA